MAATGVLPEFQEFLLSHKLAPEKNVLFLAIWVSKFLAFSNRKGQQDIESYSCRVSGLPRSQGGHPGLAGPPGGRGCPLVSQPFQRRRRVEGIVGKTRGRKADLSDRPKLLAEMKRLIRLKHFAYNTELSYLDWVERFFAYMRETVKSDPAAVLTPETVQNFLSHLAISKQVSSSTQNQALCALVFLFRDVLGQDLGDISGMVWAKRGKKLPVVLWIEEVKALFQHLSGTSLLIAQLLYGSGLRIMELARLRVLDIDFDGGI